MLKDLLPSKNKSSEDKADAAPSFDFKSVNDVLSSIVNELKIITSVVRGQRKQKDKAQKLLERNAKKDKELAGEPVAKQSYIRNKLQAVKKATAIKRGEKKPEAKAAKKSPKAKPVKAEAKTTTSKKKDGAKAPPRPKPAPKASPSAPSTPPTGPQPPQSEEESGSIIKTIMAGIGLLFAGGGLVAMFGDIIDSVLEGIGIDTKFFTNLKKSFEPIVKTATWFLDNVIMPGSAVIMELFKTSMTGWRLIIKEAKDLIMSDTFAGWGLRKLLGLKSPREKKEDDIRKEVEKDTLKPPKPAKPAKFEYPPRWFEADKIKQAQEQAQATAVAAETIKPVAEPAKVPSMVAAPEVAAPAKPKPAAAPTAKPAPAAVPAAAAPVAKPAPAAVPAAAAPTAKPSPAATEKPKGGVEGEIVQNLNESGIEDPKAVGNILATVKAESNFKPQSERVDKWSADTLMRLYGPDQTKNKVRVKSKADAQAVIDKGPEAVGDLAYGGRMGNDQPGDGYKYRGRGFIQHTGKEQYKKIASFTGMDVVDKPDLLNAPGPAAKAIAWFFLSYKGIKKDKLRDMSTVNKVIGHAGDAKQDEMRANMASAYESKLQSGTLVASTPREGQNINVASAEVNSQKERPRKTTVAVNVIDKSTTITSSTIVPPKKDRVPPDIRAIA